MLFSNVKLTKNQLQDLKNLNEKLQHPKLKKLLKRAIKTWETHGVTTGVFGIKVYNNKIEPFEENASCCLIGAGITGCKFPYKGSYDFNEMIWKPAFYVAGFSQEEVNTIWCIFDGMRPTSADKENRPLLIKEVVAIRRICFGV